MKQADNNVKRLNELIAAKDTAEKQLKELEQQPKQPDQDLAANTDRADTIGEEVAGKQPSTDHDSMHKRFSDASATLARRVGKVAGKEE